MTALFVIIGFLLGCFAGFFGSQLLRKKEQQLTDEMKNVFARVSLESLSRNSEEFMRLAKSVLEAKSGEGEKNLESKKELIDAQLKGMKDNLEKLQLFMSSIEKDREAKFSEISQQIKNTVEQTEKLTHVTGNLSRALSSSAERGRWGERMALDVVRASGMIENINYKTQQTMKNGSRPDFTFFLPKGFCINMDVKFPLDNYLRYLSENDKEQYLKAFIKDVRQKIKDVRERGYIDPAENTLDCAVIFIPNESVYEFIYENDNSIMDFAMGMNVLLASPMSLFGVLAVIRQSAENFAFDSTSSEMLKLFGEFYKQWGLFTEKLEKMGAKIEDAKKEYEALAATRRSQLEKPLNKIENLRREKGIELE